MRSCFKGGSVSNVEQVRISYCSTRYFVSMPGPPFENHAGDLTSANGSSKHAPLSSQAERAVVLLVILHVQERYPSLAESLL